MLIDFLEKGDTVGCSFVLGIKSKGIVRAEDAFFHADQVDHFAIDIRAIEEWAGGAVVVQVFDLLANARVQLVEWESAAPVG